MYRPPCKGQRYLPGPWLGVHVERYTRATPLIPQAWLALPPHAQLELPERQSGVGWSQVPAVPLVGDGGALQPLAASLAPLLLVLLPQVHAADVVCLPCLACTVVDTADSVNQCVVQNCEQRSSVVPVNRSRPPRLVGVGSKPLPPANEKALCHTRVPQR